MFTPGELEGIPVKLEKLFKDLENRIMADIIRRLKNNAGEIIRSADWQIYRLHELGESKAAIKQIIKSALDLSNDEIDKIYDDILASDYARDKSVYEVVGKEFIPFEDNEPLQQLISAVKEQTNSELKNITQSLGFAKKDTSGKIVFTPIADVYQKTLDGAVLDITSGAFDYNTVLKRTVKDFTNSGLRTVDYASGHSSRVTVAARRAVMTGFNQTVAKINEDNAKELETDTFEVTWHSGHRPSHWWGGGWYTKQELIDVCGLGSADGLEGCNCYHNHYPVIPGVSTPTYTPEELERMRADELKTTEYNGKAYTKYEALQRQRRLESKMRAQRQEINLLKEGGANEDEIIAARCCYRITSGEYTHFSEAMNIPQQRERVTIDGLGNIGAGKWKKPVEKINLDDIINLDDTAISKTIRSGKVELKIDSGKQGKHIKDHNNFIEGRSYITIPVEKAQEFVDMYAGTGTLLRNSKGKWNKQEVIITDQFIGYDVNNLTGIETITKTFKIHYSNKGTHIVPKRE